MSTSTRSVSTSYGTMNFKGLNYAVKEEEAVEAVIGEFDIDTEELKEKLRKKLEELS